jgi:hypothetical protein
MARLFTSGWETGLNQGEGMVPFGTTSVTNAAPVRSGGFSFKCSANSSGTGDVTGLSGATDRWWYARVYLYLNAAVAGSQPLEVVIVKGGGGNLAKLIVHDFDQKLYIRNSADADVGGSSSVALTTGRWYCCEIGVKIGAGSTDEVKGRLDGTQFASASGLNLSDTVPDTFFMGWHLSGTAPDFALDDFALNDSTGAAQNSWPGEGKIVLLKPISDNAVGTGWTQPETTGDDTTDIWVSVDNTPPVGVAHSDADANQLFYIFNDDNLGASSSYDANCQTYTTGGIVSTYAIKVVQGLVRVATSSLTGTNTGEARLASNPDDGSNTAINFEGAGAIAGTEPTGWKTYQTVANYAPSVTLGNSPVMRVTRTQTGITRAHMCDFMGVNVDYELNGNPATGNPMRMIV